MRKYLILILFLAASFGIWRFWFAPKRRLETSLVEKKNLEITVELSGKIKAVNEVVLSFSLTGEVELVASSGAAVKPGDILARLKTSDLWASLQQAYANLNRVRSSFYNLLEVKGEADSLYGGKGDAVSLAKLNQARTAAEAGAAAVEAAQFEVDKSRAVLAKAFIKAPFEGRVAQVNPKVGEVVSAVSPVLTLIDPRSYYFEAEVDEIDVVNLTAGQPVRLKLDTDPDKVLNGVVNQIEVVAHLSPAGGTVYGVRIDLPGQAVEAAPDDLVLKSGFNGEAQIVKESKIGSLVIPSSAVGQKEGRARVKVYRDGREEEREVILGEFVDGFYEVLAGLAEGETVVNSVQK